jgi:uncharacterized protein YabN with tetrapyrrole methylase and pyrophosphatase domain
MPSTSTLSAPTDILSKIVEFEKANERFGFYWQNIDEILAQIHSECDETKEAWSKGDKQHTQEEVGDIIHAAICLCVFLGFDPLETLQANVQKFQTRYTALADLVKQDGLEDLNNQPHQVLLDYWAKAKKLAYKHAALIEK